MNFQELFLVVSVFLVIVRASLVREVNCSSCGYDNICEHGDCYAENCQVIGCRCFKGWIGDICDQECHRDCNNGVCYVENGNEHCSCQFGFNSSTNCSEPKEIGKHNIIYLFVFLFFFSFVYLRKFLP